MPHSVTATSGNRGGPAACAGRLVTTLAPWQPHVSRVGCLNRVKHQQPTRLSTLQAFGAEDSLLFLPNGEAIAMPKKRNIVGPAYDLDRDGALRVQLEALQQNNVPHADHGIEVLYRFADFNPFERCTYFGRSLDLGQFERFRRVMHSPYYAPLLEHSGYDIISSLEVREDLWCVRLLVRDTHRLEEQSYDITLAQRLGGHYDGYWFTQSLVCEGQEWQKVLAYGI